MTYGGKQTLDISLGTCAAERQTSGGGTTSWLTALMPFPVRKFGVCAPSPLVLKPTLSPSPLVGAGWNGGGGINNELPALGTVKLCGSFGSSGGELALATWPVSDTSSAAAVSLKGDGVVSASFMESRRKSSLPPGRLNAWQPVPAVQSIRATRSALVTLPSMLAIIRHPAPVAFATPTTAHI
jgi:hypothetical protein